MADEDDTELVEFEDVLPDVEDTDDGGAIVRLEEEDGALPGESDFYANLAEDMPTWELKKLATDLIENIGRDKTARGKRDELYAEGIKRTGLGDEAPGGARFEGASKVVHPMLVEACVDFAARAMKELWPATGPVKTKIEGDETPEKTDRAERKAKLMNWQLTVQSQEFRAEVEQMLTQVPLGGAQYLKLSWDRKRNRPGALAVFVDDMLIPFAATNFYAAERKTHVQYLTTQEYDERVRTGMYRDVDLIPSSIEPEQTAAAKASDKIEGREATAYNEDGLRTVYESYISMMLNKDDEPCPYIITTDKSTNDVLAIYRNWEEDDDTAYEPLEWVVEFPFIPWRGAYPIGLPHIIGGLSGAATGALRALLDSAHIQNTPSGLKLKGAMISGQTRAPDVGEILEIDGGMAVDDIRKVFMPMPYNQPSPVLFQLLGFLVDAGKGVVRTTLDDIADNDPNVPVGTTLARMEQGMVVYSSIHGRLHDSMGRVLRILHRFDRMYLKDADVEREVGKDMAKRKDFTGPMDIVPVSDPNIFSEAQRYAQAEAVTQRSAMLPQLYNMRKVEERFLETLKVPNIDELLVPPVEPEATNPVAENVAMSLGRPVVAFPDQNHMAHMHTHVDFFMNPALGQNPLFQQTYVGPFVQHMKEHMVLWYMQASLDIAEEYTGLDIDKAMKQHEGSDDFSALDGLLAEASAVVGEEAVQMFEKLMPVLQQAQQMAAQLQPPQPMDPMAAQAQIAASQVKAEEAKAQGAVAKSQADVQKSQIGVQEAQLEAQTKQAEAQGRQAEGQQKAALEGAKLQQKAESDSAKLQQQGAAKAADVELAREQMQNTNLQKQADIEAKLEMNEADNLTAMALAQAEIESGERIAVSTGTGINPQPGKSGGGGAKPKAAKPKPKPKPTGDA